MFDYDYSCSLENILTKINDTAGELYIFGTGAMAEIAFRLTQRYNIQIKAFIIDDKYYSSSDHKGICVMRFSSYVEICKETDYVWICLDNLEAREAVASKIKTRNVIKTSFPIEAYRKDFYLDFDYYSQHKDEFKNTYDLLADETSRKTMENYVYACISGNIEPLISENIIINQYFNELTKECDCSTFLDCGSFIGDSIIDALRFYGDQSVKRIIAFEPDENNIAKINESVANGSIPTDKFTLLKYGVSDKYAVLHFSSNGDGSAICDDGDIQIEVDAIDNLVHEPVTFIKMDVEGSEYDALVGATNIIKDNIPTLAICVYHKREDLIEIPALIRSIVGNNTYDFYIRHHQSNLTELVLYAIPRKQQ